MLVKNEVDTTNRILFAQYFNLMKTKAVTLPLMCILIDRDGSLRNSSLVALTGEEQGALKKRGYDSAKNLEAVVVRDPVRIPMVVRTPNGSIVTSILTKVLQSYYSTTLTRSIMETVHLRPHRHNVSVSVNGLSMTLEWCETETRFCADQVVLMAEFLFEGTDITMEVRHAILGDLAKSLLENTSKRIWIDYSVVHIAWTKTVYSDIL